MKACHDKTQDGSNCKFLIRIIELNTTTLRVTALCSFFVSQSVLISFLYDKHHHWFQSLSAETKYKRMECIQSRKKLRSWTLAQTYAYVHAFLISITFLQTSLSNRGLKRSESCFLISFNNITKNFSRLWRFFQCVKRSATASHAGKK